MTQRLAFALVLSLGLASAAGARERAAPWHARKLDVSQASGVSFSPGAGRLFVARTRQGSVELLAVDLVGHEASAPIRAAGLRDAALAYDPATARLLALDATAGVLVDMPLSPDGRPDPRLAREIDAAALGAAQPTALALDPASGDLFLVDAAAGRIVRVERRAWSATEWDPTNGGISVLEIDPALGDAGAHPRGFAFHPESDHLFLLDASGLGLHELAETGELVGSEDLSGLGLSDPRGIAFAPSGDLTDDPSRQSLYVADARARSGRDPVRGERGGIVEVAVGRELASVAALTSIPTVVQTILTSQFTPPSPDPSGIGYDPLTDRLVISDGEVDEMPIYAGVNVWEISRTGSVLATSTTLPFSDEPTGVAVDRPGNRYFFSYDDTPQRVFVVNLGSDGSFGTSDDVVSSIVTTLFACGDPEGVAFDDAQQRLFIASGLDAEIFTVTPGVNGVFDGVPPAGDDVVAQFDTEVLGVLDPEGVEYDAGSDTLFIVDRNTRTVAETTPDGLLLNVFDISFLGGNPAGAARAPATDQPTGVNLYVVDRRVDNNTDPNENDGRLYEIRVEGVPGVLDLQVNAGSDDAEERPTGTVTLTSNDIELVEDGTLNQKVGMRFTGVAIPPDAPILVAYLQFMVDEATSGSTSLVIQGQLADDPLTFTTASQNVSSRPRTLASVPWSPPPWAPVGLSGPDQRTPNLAPIVQELVNLPGWTSGNSMAFLVTGTGARVADSWEGDPLKAPRLHVEIAPFVCGNSVLELGEACDDGNTVTEACSYGQTSCLVCGAACQELPGATSFCGDTLLDAAHGEQCDDGNTTAGDGCDPSCQISVACSDGIDNDGDSKLDFPDDPGCTDALDESELGAVECDNELDDDGDGFIDFPDDPGCTSAATDAEQVQCQDGVDNEGDGTVDFDGGASLNGGVPFDDPDATCAGIAAKNKEKTGSCGLGFELALLLPLLQQLRARRRFGFPSGTV